MIERIAGQSGPTAARAASPAAATKGAAGSGRADGAERTFSLTAGQPTTAPPPSTPGPEPASLGRTLKVAMNRLERQRATIDRAIRQARGGQTFSPAELLALQSQVYTYSQELEVISRMVDRTVSSLKTTLNTQL